MKYELSQLGSDGFERLIQSLLGGETYGDGPDGQREVVIRNARRLPALPGLTVEGYLMAQVKYKSPEGAEKEWSWLKRQLEYELNGFRKKEEQNEKLKQEGKTAGLYRLPNTWLFFTNVVLTPTLHTGLKDKADALADKYRDLIPNIYILGKDDVQTMLDNRPMVAAAFPTLINDGLRSWRALRTYVRLCFTGHANVDVKQAGDEVGRMIDLRGVYTDLSVQRHNDTCGFAEFMVSVGDIHAEEIEVLREHRGSSNYHRSFTLLGEAGRGKSTVCRLLCQIYRAAILRQEARAPAEAKAYLMAPEGTEPLPTPTYTRIPITVTLKKYAAWLEGQADDAGDLRNYMVDTINDRIRAQLSGTDFWDLLKQESWLFCFDGLDEVPAASNRGRVIEKLVGFLDMLRQEGCDHLTVLTSRPQGFDGHPALSYRSEVLTLQPMEPERCMKYLRRLLPHLERDPEEQQAKLRVMEGALKDPTTAKLMETPLYASILLILARSGGNLPTRRYDLFKEYCETITRRERQKGLLADLDKSYHWVLQVHRELALLLQRESSTTDNAAAELTLGRLHSLLLKYLDRQDFEGDREEMAKNLQESMTRRLPFLSQTTDAEGVPCVLFPLRSVQEYYAAEGLLALPDQNKIGDALRAISRSAYWRNVFLFVAGCFTCDVERYSLLNDRLYTICRMNNGDEAFCTESDPVEPCKLTHPGSLLALDLLREGIFNRASDKRRYCDLLEPLLREPVCVTGNQTLDNLRELPKEITQRLLQEVIIPLLERSQDGDSMGFILLWILGCRKNARLEASEALARLAPSVHILRFDTLKTLERFGLRRRYEVLPAEDLLYRLASENFFDECTIGYPMKAPKHKLLNFCADYALSREWTKLPTALLRLIYYSYFINTSWKLSPQVIRLEPTLFGKNSGFRDIRHLLFNVRRNNEGGLFYYFFIPHLEDIPEGFQAYLKMLRERGLPDLVALLMLYAKPSIDALHEVIRIWNSAELKHKACFLRALRAGSWYCQKVANALAQGDGYEKLEADLSQIEEKEKALQRWIADPISAIRAGWWEKGIRVDASFTPYTLKISLNDVLQLLQTQPMDRQFCNLLYVMTRGMDTLPSEVIALLLDQDRLSILEETRAGHYLVLRLFAELPLSELLGRFRWPDRVKNVVRGRFVSGKNLDTVRRRIELLTFDFELVRQAFYLERPCWEACAMIPLLEPYLDLTKPIRLPRGCYGSIHATENRAAWIGGILSLLAEPLGQKDQPLLEADLKDLFADAEQCAVLARACNRFCAEGLLLVRRLAAAAKPESEDHCMWLRDIQDICIQGLRADLENAPVTLPTM